VEPTSWTLLGGNVRPPRRYDVWARSSSADSHLWSPGRGSGRRIPEVTSSQPPTLYEHSVRDTGGHREPNSGVFARNGRGGETRGAALIAGSARGCEHAPEHTTGIEVKIDPHERAHDGIAHDGVDLEIARRVFVNA